MKVLNSINLIPIAAFFVPLPFQYAAGILPGYWPMRALWSAVTADSYGLHLVVGAVTSVLAITATAALFDGDCFDTRDSLFNSFSLGLPGIARTRLTPGRDQKCAGSENPRHAIAAPKAAGGGRTEFLGAIDLLRIRH